MFAAAAVIVVLLSLIVVYLLLLETFFKRKTNQNIPSPTGWPFLGNLPAFYGNIDRIDDWLCDLFQQYGDTFVLHIPGKPDFVFTTNPKNVEHILKTNFENYPKGNFFKNNLHDLLGDGIFNSDGETWRSQRKITSNLFNVKNFKEGMLHVFVDHSEKVLDIISRSPHNVDASDLFYRFTLDSIGCIAFGKDIGSIGNPEVEFAVAWDRSNAAITERFYSLSTLLRKLHPAERMISKDIETMNKFADEILQARKNENAETLAGRFDLLSLFLSKKNSEGVEYSDTYLKDMILNMIIAGRDTTAQSLAWTCYLLAQHDHVRRKIMEEVDPILGDSGVPDYETLKSMEYLDAVVSESLRLYPSVPKDFHTCTVQDTLPTGHVVDNGSAVFYAAYCMGRSRDLWGDDACEFRPERFIEDPKQKSNTFKFTAFQGGPRTCLGQNMAYLEEKTLLAMMFQRFDISLVQGQQVRSLLSLTLPMKQGLKLNFVQRVKSS